MKKLVSVLAVAGFVATLGAPLFASDKTIKGELVDQGCYLKKAENKGADHESCALRCAKKGLPLAIVADDGVYEITGDYAKDNNKKIVDGNLVAKIVTAKGEVTEKDGKKMIDAKSITLADAK